MALFVPCVLSPTLLHSMPARGPTIYGTTGLQACVHFRQASAHFAHRLPSVTFLYVSVCKPGWPNRISLPAKFDPHLCSGHEEAAGQEQYDPRLAAGGDCSWTRCGGRGPGVLRGVPAVVGVPETFSGSGQGGSILPPCLLCIIPGSPPRARSLRQSCLVLSALHTWHLPSYFLHLFII